MDDAMKPRAYDLEDPAERRRLFRECRGYLQTCHHKHGTDWEGRKFAMDALGRLDQIKAPALDKDERAYLESQASIKSQD